jgi:DNA-binding transcriptional MerR regulator
VTRTTRHTGRSDRRRDSSRRGDPGQDRFRIGEVAERVGVTTRTIRYYEEVGLLGREPDRAKGAHRVYSAADVARLRELIRLRDLLGLSLDELVVLAEAEEARAALRNLWYDDPSDEERLRIVDEAIPLVERQLSLVRVRQKSLTEFSEELETKLRSLRQRRRTLAASSGGKKQRERRA